MNPELTRALADARIAELRRGGVGGKLRHWRAAASARR